MLGGSTRMVFIIGIYIFCIAAAVIVPTLPSSRRTRLILSVASIFVIVFGYQYVERFASRIGSDYMDIYVEHSAQLLRDGRTNILQAAYADYQEQHGGRVPASASAAYRAFLLRSLIRQHELEEEK